MKKISRKSFLKLAAATTAGTAMAPALMGCAWPDTQDHTPYKGDIVLLLSNDIHSNLGNIAFFLAFGMWGSLETVLTSDINCPIL